MTEKTFFGSIKTCNELNESNVFRYWNANKKYVISDFFTKIIYIILLMIVLSINTYLTCKSIKDILLIL